MCEAANQKRDIWVKVILEAANEGREGETEKRTVVLKKLVWLGIRAKSLLIDPEGVTGIEL